MRLVAEQCRAEMRHRGGDGLRRHVHQLGQWRARCRGVELVDHIPRQKLVGGDGETVSDGLRQAEQPDKGFGEVRAVREGPERGSVTVHQHGAAGPHADNVTPPAGERNRSLVVGMRGAHDRDRESLLAVGRHQQVFPGDLVSGVLRVRVAKRRGFQNRQSSRRLLVGRRRTDKHELARAPREQLDIGCHVFGREGNEVDDDIEGSPAHSSPDRGRVASVRGDHLHTGRNRALGCRRPVQHREAVPGRNRSCGGGSADHAGAANEQHVEPAHHHATLAVST